MNDAVKKSRLLWACRRGMLELDTLFMPFVTDVYGHLSELDKKTFERLLECDDPSLFSWFMGHKQCDDPELVKMIDAIRANINT